MPADGADLRPTGARDDVRRRDTTVTEGCTWVTNQVRELGFLYSRDITYAVFCQGPYEESRRYRDFMGWEMPWYSALPSNDELLTGRQVGSMHIVCYLREGDRVYETYWTTLRGVEVMDYDYALLDLTVYGRQELWEDSPSGLAADHGRPPRSTPCAPTAARSRSGHVSRRAAPTT
ncbi:DUF899 family protein [Streptomyces globisporus]|uniref:DUF899 family protein n=1 Tax=Streptomyces globisporus TaxID=1908 RepID=UPI00345F6DD6